MKRLRRWALRLLLTLIVLSVVGILLLDVVARAVLVREIQDQSGLPTKIGRVHIGLIHPEITIEKLVLYNTAEFGGKPFLELPELHIEYDRNALFSHKLHCKFVRLNIASFNIVEDSKGRRNLDYLEPKKQPRAVMADPLQKKAAQQKGSPAIEFIGIDKLNLTLGKATYSQLAPSGEVDQLVMNCDHQNFPGIKTEQDVQGLLLIVFLRSRASLRPDGSSRDWFQVFSPDR